MGISHVKSRAKITKAKPNKWNDKYSVKTMKKINQDGATDNMNVNHKNTYQKEKKAVFEV